MPELPEVEYFSQYFNRTAKNKPIAKVLCGDEELLEDTNCTFLGRALHQQEFADAHRRGKFLIAEVKDTGYCLIFHFGMTGYLSYGKTENRNEEEEDHGHLILQFTNGYELRFVNIRKIGGIYFVRDPDQVELISQMGPEPFDLSEEEFLELLSEHEVKNIKSFLMDQHDIAGVGNEYSDEILFRAEIDPHREISDISQKERTGLYNTMISTLEDAVEAKPPKNGLDKNWLRSHKEDLVCPKNKDHELVNEEIAGRSALWCPKHQS